MKITRKIASHYVRTPSQKIAAHYVAAAIGTEVAQQFLDNLKGVRPTQQDLQKFSDGLGLDGEDVKNLIYDLQKLGIHDLKKPNPSSNPIPQQQDASLAGRILAGTKAGKFGSDLRIEIGSLKDDDRDDLIKSLAKTFVHDPALYGQFIGLAEKEALEIYESDFVDDCKIPITAAVLRNVSDDYIISSILFASIYGSKSISDDGIAYVWKRIGQPLKVLSKHGYDSSNLSTAVDGLTNHFDASQIEKWLSDLDTQDLKEMRDDLDDKTQATIDGILAKRP